MTDLGFKYIDSHNNFCKFGDTIISELYKLKILNEDIKLKKEFYYEFAKTLSSGLNKKNEFIFLENTHDDSSNYLYPYPYLEGNVYYGKDKHYKAYYELDSILHLKFNYERYEKIEYLLLDFAGRLSAEIGKLLIDKYFIKFVDVTEVANFDNFISSRDLTFRFSISSIKKFRTYYDYTGPNYTGANRNFQYIHGINKNSWI